MKFCRFYGKLKHDTSLIFFQEVAAAERVEIVLKNCFSANNILETLPLCNQFFVSSVFNEISAFNS